MRRRRLLLLSLAVVVCAAPAAAQNTTTANAAAAITKTSAPAMFAVARALVEETWTPRLDKALAAKAALIMDRYARSNELAGHIAAEVGRIGPGPDLDAAVAALTGPAGKALVRQEAKKEFIVSSMTATPDGPKVGTPEWNRQLGDLGKRFDARVGPGLPPLDGSHTADVEKLAVGPVATLLSRVWMFAIANVERQLNTAINLMVLDETQKKDAFSLEKMAVCQDSWLDWGADDSRVGAFRDSFRAQFKESGSGGYFVPLTSATLMGMPVARVYASTIGMARGFSVAVDAPFDTARRNVEKTLGRTLEKCDTGDGMRTCALEIAEKRTVMLMTEATGKDKTTLVGCFYFYEK